MLNYQNALPRQAARLLSANVCSVTHVGALNAPPTGIAWANVPSFQNKHGLMCRSALLTLPLKAATDESKESDTPPLGRRQVAGGHVRSVDYSLLAASCAELRQRWVPSKVENLVMADQHTIALNLRTMEDQGWLYISWHPNWARLSLGETPLRGNASEEYPFGKAARERLQGQVLVSVHMPAAFDRVLGLRFAARPGETTALQLMCEIQGYVSNVLLLDGADNIMLAAHQVGKQQTASRTLQTGMPYELPPTPQKAVPNATELRASWQSRILENGASIASSGKQTGLALAITQAYRGTSPTLSENLCQLARLDPLLSPSGLLDTEWARLHAAWQEWLDWLASGSSSLSQDLSTGELSVLPIHSERLDGVLRSLEDFIGSSQQKSRIAELHARQSKAVARALRKLESKRCSLLKQQGSIEAADATHKLGDLVMANLHCWPSGSHRLTVEDWDTGEQIELKLPDKCESPLEYAQSLYKRSAKQRRAVDRLMPLLEQLDKQLSYVEGVQECLVRLAECASISIDSGCEGGEKSMRALQQVQEELVEQGLMERPQDHAMAVKVRVKTERAARRRAKGSGSKLGMFRQFQCPSGLMVLIGRNNTQNDELSMKIANDGDVWMHAKDVPGSHLIIQIPKGQEASDEDIAFAANLCAYFSKARKGGKCKVTVTAAKYIKKFPGAKPGQVLVEKDSVVMGRPQLVEEVIARAV